MLPSMALLGKRTRKAPDLPAFAPEAVETTDAPAIGDFQAEPTNPTDVAGADVQRTTAAPPTSTAPHENVEDQWV